MFWSQLFIPTLRETPAEADTASHRLLLRAGYLRQLAPGLYSHLFLAQRSLRKIAAIVREEMDAIGGQEMSLPVLDPAGLRDQAGRELSPALSPEEAIAAVARELRSYKQLPQIWYRVQTRFHDPLRPRPPLLRARQFLVAESYSFDIDAAGLEASCDSHRRACRRIFERCGLEVLAVADPRGCEEFRVATTAGEDYLAQCRACGYAASLEAARSHPAPPPLADPEGDLEPEKFHTPGRKTIADVAGFTGLPEASQMKSLVLVADARQPYLVMLRGDHSLSETKFLAAAGAGEVRPAHPDEIRELFGADPGSLGPLGAKNLPVLADDALRGRRNMICGANQNDYHLRNVTPGEDFSPRWHDLRQVVEGDLCVRCAGPLELRATVQIGHIRKRGRQDAHAPDLRVTGAAGEEVPVILGSYGIDLDQILSAAVELHHDDDGMTLAPAIAPFAVVVTPVFIQDQAQRQAAAEIHAACLRLGLEALLDDRDERAGVKFKDADLIGVPYRITLGKKLAQGLVEVVERRTRHKTDVPAADAARFVADKVAS